MSESNFAPIHSVDAEIFHGVSENADPMVALDEWSENQSLGFILSVPNFNNKPSNR